MRGPRAVALLVGAMLAAACSTPVSPVPSLGSPEVPSVSPSASPVAVASPPGSPLPALPTETAAHLKWVKTKTNLPPRAAHNGFQLAIRPGSPPLYVLIDAFQEVWVSSDAVQWDLASKLKAPVTAIDSTDQLVFTGSTFVALDREWFYPSDPDDGPFSGVTGGHTWVSGDGQAWSFHPLPNVAFREGLVEAGEIVAMGGITGEFEPVLGTSTDGVSWSTSKLTGDPWSVTPDHQVWSYITGLAGDRTHGVVAAVASIDLNANACDGSTLPLPTPPKFDTPVPILWRSTDLQSWTPVASATMECGRVTDVIRGPRGYLAVGKGQLATRDNNPMRAWFSRDGLTWTEVAMPPPFAELGGRSLAIAPDGTFLHYADEIWESTDGQHWFLSAPATNAFVYQVVGDVAFACGDDTCWSLRMGPS